VLSGGAAEVALDGRLGAVGDYLDGLDVPILGVCAAHQYMAQHFGGKLVPGRSPEFGAVEITITDQDDLLRGIPSPTVVWANHNDDIAQVPPGFKVLASSPDCAVQVMRHKTRPLFGTAFHPEVEHTVEGVAMFRNFVRICEEAKAARIAASPKSA
jgi:GMP synthase (glutamine-hydrolysing)